MLQASRQERLLLKAWSGLQTEWVLELVTCMCICVCLCIRAYMYEYVNKQMYEFS